MAPGKRKRNDRASIDGGDSRPSPHRPANMNLGQHEVRDGGNRRASRGDRGGSGGGRGGGRGRNDRNDQNRPSLPPTPTTGPMSPPVRPPSAVQTPSQASTPVTEVPPPVPVSIPAPTPAPRADPPLYDYYFLTDERIAAWKETGRAEVVAAGTQARQDEDTTDLASVFQEFIRAALDGRLDATDAGSCVKTILGPDASIEAGTFDPATLLVDVLSIICDAEPTPISPLLRNFAVATGVSATLMRESLDAPTLSVLGLTRDTFYRAGIRFATHLLYRQANYNLLREESEGYAKLVNELYTISIEEGDKIEVIGGAFEKLKGLIGAFNLDVGRVLDITLDVFAALLVSRYRFFICFLRQSSWWPRTDTIPGISLPELLPSWALPTSNDYFTSPEELASLAERKHHKDVLFWERARAVGLDAFFELGAHELVDDETKERLLRDQGESQQDETENGADVDRQWIFGTSTLPPHGNRTAAQLLGFKLRFYHSDARDESDQLPQNVLYLTALLIKVGFISLRDIYPHLSASDEDMEVYRTEKLEEIRRKEREQRPGAKANALVMAAALSDDTVPVAGKPRDVKSDSKNKDKEKEEEDEKEKKKKSKKVEDPQKVQLLAYLLTIGAIPESLFILGQYPWVTETNPDLSNLMNRIIHHSINEVYDSVSRPVEVVPGEMQPKLAADYNQSGVPKGDIRLTQVPTRAFKRWPFPDKNDERATNYRYYWDEWADNVPVCKTIDDFFTLASTFLNCSGVEIGRDTSLLAKIARLGNTSLHQDSSQHNMSRWQDLLKRIIVPALSFTRSNASIVNEVYDMLRHYPLPVRYSIYAEWYEGQISRLSAMQREFTRTEAEAMSVLKRISKTNIPTMARSLAKVAYGSPGIVFRVALGQIEVYQNLTEVVVECAKYFTDLGYDVLVWSLMSALGGDRKRSSKDSPLLPSDWLLALSRFAGKIFKRYSIISPSPILQYVNHQLYRNVSMDLQVLKELIAQMAGIVPNIDFTDSELAAMTGWEMLRRITLTNAKDNRYTSEKTSKRLTKALVDTRLAGELLVGIAQYRQSAIYLVEEHQAHIKFLATLVDDTQSILSQYLDLLRTVLPVEDFDKHVPDIPELLTEYGLQPALAFMIGRVSVLSRIAVATSPAINGTSKTSPAPETPVVKAADTGGDVDMDKDVIQSTESDAADATIDSTMKDSPSPAVKEATPAVLGDSTTEPVLDKFQQCLEPIVSAVKGLNSEDTWKHLSPEFYVTFWVTTLSELNVPKASYEAVATKISEDLKALARPDGSRTSSSEKTQRKLALADQQIALDRERIQHMEYAQKLRIRFSRRKASWFPAGGKSDELSDDVLEKCLLPRLLQSRTDADFCFSMIKYMHDTGTPHFRLLSLYSRLFKTHRLRSIIFTCTNREAENLGRFLRAILGDLSRWHQSKDVYSKEAHGSIKSPHLIGFAKALDEDGKPKAFLEHDGERGFTSILLQWHRNINSAIRACFEGTEWMHIRNAITVLQAVSPAFPAIDFMGAGFIKQLEEIADREKATRADLALVANSALVPLKKAKTWVTVQFFRSGIDTPQVNGSATPTPQGISTPKTSLKATAAEFKPRVSSTPASTPKPTANEVEDGEVDDAKKLRTGAKPIELIDTPKAKEDVKPAEPAKPAEAPKKSEVLLRREQILRENAAKAAAAQAAQNSRHDSPRHASNTPSSRENTSLPVRPDAPFPSRHELERPARHGDRRDGRDARSSDGNRPNRGSERTSERSSDRISDRNSDRPRELLGNDRGRTDGSVRDFPRSSDRSAPSDRSRPDPPPRWTADSPREHQERVALQGRGTESSRLPRDLVESSSRTDLQDRSSNADSDRGPSVNPQRQELINPARAALISKAEGGRDSPRHGRDDPRDRTSSRNDSPRRSDGHRDGHESRREERGGRSGQDDGYHDSRSRQDDHQYPPAGPRSDRVSDRQMPADRSAFQPSQQNQARSIDPDHGRLNAPSRAPVDPNFGRLNAVSAAPDIPQGPRAPNSRGNRPPQQTSVNQTPRRDGPHPQSPPQQPPSGPSSGRHPRRTDSGQFNHNSVQSNNSVPTTPVAPSPVAAVHPDRLRQLPVQAQPVTTPRSEPVGAGMHPDRARAYGVDIPANNQQRPGSSSQQSLSANQGPPSGPKVTQANPINNGNNMSAPTGPASANERAQRGGRRQIAGINTMLQQSNSSPSIQVRGRGRPTQGSFNDNPNQIPSPMQPQNHGHPPAPVHDSRDLVNPMRADLINNGPNNDDRDRSRRRDHTDSRRGSRSPGRDRGSSKRQSGEDDRAGGEHRDRRGDERDRYPNRSDPQQDLMARDSRGGNARGHERQNHPDLQVQGQGQDQGQYQNQDQNQGWHHPGGGGGDRNGQRGERGSERGGRSRDLRHEHRDDRRGNGGGGGGGGMRGEEGRKRHSEGGEGERGREKRPRRG